MSEVDIEGVNAHVDAITAALESAHAAHPNSPELDALHDDLGAGWEFLKSELGIQDANRSGNPKPPREP